MASSIKLDHELRNAEKADIPIRVVAARPPQLIHIGKELGVGGVLEGHSFKQLWL